MKFSVCMLVLAMAALASPAAFGDTIILHPSADTGLFENVPENNLGGNAFIPVGTTVGGMRNRALFRFDLAGSIPAGATIESVTLKLTSIHASAQGGGPIVCSLHRLLQNWNEGDKSGFGGGVVGETAEPGETSWSHRSSPATEWGEPGAESGVDYVAAGSATGSVPAIGTAEFTGAQLAADVQMWVDDPDGNFGWILVMHDESVTATARQIASREHPTEAPALTIQFTPPPLRPVIGGISQVNGQLQFTFDAAVGQPYAVEARETLASGEWFTLTNFSPGAAATNVVVTDSIGPGSRFYRVRVP